MKKTCKKCGETLLAEENFYKDSGSKSGFRNACKFCERKRSKEYHFKNHDKNKKRLKRYHQEDINRHSERLKKYYEKNKESVLEYKSGYREENREILRQRQTIYRKSDKGKVTTAMNRQIRRHRNKLVLTTLTPEQWKNCINHFEGKCCYCGSSEELQQEHFVPLSKGGGYTKDNILPSCGTCNAKKYNLSFADWYPNYLHYDEAREQKILKYLNYSNKNQQMSIL